MSNTVTANVATQTEPVDANAGTILVTITGPAGYSKSTTLGSAGGSASFDNGGQPLTPGTYTITALSQDSNGKPAAFGGVAYPSVTTTVTVSQEQAAVVSAITATVA